MPQAVLESLFCVWIGIQMEIALLLREQRHPLLIQTHPIIFVLIYICVHLTFVNVVVLVQSDQGMPVHLSEQQLHHLR
jgi:hypothetical protein